MSNEFVTEWLVSVSPWIKIPNLKIENETFFCLFCSESERRRRRKSKSRNGIDGGLLPGKSQKWKIWTIFQVFDCKWAVLDRIKMKTLDWWSTWKALRIPFKVLHIRCSHYTRMKNGKVFISFYLNFFFSASLILRTLNHLRNLFDCGFYIDCGFFYYVQPLLYVDLIQFEELRTAFLIQKRNRWKKALK